MLWPRGRRAGIIWGMRRLGIVTFVLLLVLFGGYSAVWFVVADRIAEGVRRWADQALARNLDLSWQSLRVAGYPLAYQIELGEARLRDTTSGRALELRTPVVSASARPWNFRLWEVSAPAGLAAIAGPADAPVATLTARAAEGQVTLTAERRTDVRLGLEDPALVAGGRLAAREATLALSVPEEPPRTHREPAFSLALDLRDVDLPAVPAPLRDRVDEIALDLRVMGAIPDAPPRRAAEAWRDAGGTIELDGLAVRWGELGFTGSGTVALDSDMQPEVAFSGSVQGYNELMAAFGEAGLLRAGDARLARLALSILAKPGPNGKPQIATSFAIQNGEMFLGPAKLGKAPHIAWR